MAAEEGQGMGAHPQLAHILSMEGAVRTSARSEMSLCDMAMSGSVLVAPRAR